MEKNEPDNLIHCLLYCFTGKRFEEKEWDILIKLRKAYEGNRLPIIIVYTRSYDEDDEDGEKKVMFDRVNSVLLEKCDEKISNEAKSISLVEVVAKIKKMGAVFHPRGLDKLIEICSEKGEFSSKA